MSIEVWGELKKYMLRAKLRNGRHFAPSYFRRDPFDFAQGKEALRFHQRARRVAACEALSSS